MLFVDSDGPVVQVGFVDGLILDFEPRLERTDRQRREDAKRFAGGTRRQLRDTNRYNCFGLVLGARKGWWVPTDDDSVTDALKADGYRQVSSPTELLPGDIVLYSRDGEIDHIAIVTGLYTSIVDNRKGTNPEGRDILVVSKFGPAPEFEHALYDVPTDIYGQPSQFWTLRFE